MFSSIDSWTSSSDVIVLSSRVRRFPARSSLRLASAGPRIADDLLRGARWDRLWPTVAVGPPPRPHLPRRPARAWPRQRHAPAFGQGSCCGIVSRRRVRRPSVSRRFVEQLGVPGFRPSSEAWPCLPLELAKSHWTVSFHAATEYRGHRHVPLSPNALTHACSLRLVLPLLNLPSDIARHHRRVADDTRGSTTRFPHAAVAQTPVATALMPWMPTFDVSRPEG